MSRLNRRRPTVGIDGTSLVPQLWHNLGTTAGTPWQLEVIGIATTAFTKFEIQPHGYISAEPVVRTDLINASALSAAIRGQTSEPGLVRIQAPIF